MKSMNLFACSIKLALLLSSVASCHINHTQFVYLSTISLFYFFPSLICKALSFHLSSKHNQIQSTQFLLVALLPCSLYEQRFIFNFNF